VLACAASLFQPGALAAEAASAVEEPSPVQPGQGIVAGTLVMDFQDSSPELRAALIAGSAMSVTIRRQKDSDAQDITFSTVDRRAPGMTRATSSEQRLLFVRALPAGDYEITQRGVAALTSHVWDRIPGGALRFMVAPGVITYIGAEVVRAHGGKDWIGVTHFQSANMSIEDDVTDDRLQLYHARPELRELPIRDGFNGALLPAPGLSIEAEGRAVSDTMPFRDVAALKASGNIPPGVFVKLEAFRPSAPPVGRGTLRRIVLHRAVTRDGKAIGGNTRTLEYLADAPGYVYDVTSSSSGPVRMLQYMPFIPVRLRAITHVESKSLLHLDRDSSNSLRLSDAQLPAFDAALAPGASWAYEYETDTSIRTKTVMQTRNHSNFSIIKRQCRTAERQPASPLSPDLAGTMISISCVSTDQPGDELTMAYLDDYGAFVLLRQSATLPPDGARVVSEYSVVRVEMAGQPAAAATAASAAEESSDAE
jgi:hypothetical protein